MPALLTALAQGRVSELGASIAVRETACLAPEQRRQVDAELAAVVEDMSIGQIEQATRRRVQELDVEASVKRAAKARADRRVTIRPQADCMARVSALVPVEQGVAVYAALLAAAATARAAGDDRTKGQVMADTVVERVTGQTLASAVPVEIGVIMTADALLGRTDTPAHLPGYGPIPAALARQLATAGGITPRNDSTCNTGDIDSRAAGDRAGDDDSSGGDGGDRDSRHDGERKRSGGGDGGECTCATVTDVTAANRARAWIRRLNTDPIDGTLTSMDTRRRRFSGALATFIRLRDQVCRDPYCDAPIRDLDHLHDHAAGGPTSADNGIGLCQRGNLVDQIPGWRTTGTSRQRFVVTPTGHTYPSRPPPALGPTLTSPTTSQEEAQAG